MRTDLLTSKPPLRAACVAILLSLSACSRQPLPGGYSFFCDGARYIIVGAGGVAEGGPYDGTPHSVTGVGISGDYIFIRQDVETSFSRWPPTVQTCYSILDTRRCRYTASGSLASVTSAWNALGVGPPPAFQPPGDFEVRY